MIDVEGVSQHEPEHQVLRVITLAGKRCVNTTHGTVLAATFLSPFASTRLRSRSPPFRSAGLPFGRLFAATSTSRNLHFVYLIRPVGVMTAGDIRRARRASANRAKRIPR